MALGLQRFSSRARAAGRDSDGDGISDMDEIAEGTDPDSPLERPGMSVLLDMATGALPGVRRKWKVANATPCGCLKITEPPLEFSSDPRQVT